MQNYVARLKEKTDGGFTDEQLKQYAEEHSEVPDDPNAPYVVGWAYNSNEDFYVLWSSKLLLEKQLKSELIQVRSMNFLCPN